MPQPAHKRSLERKPRPTHRRRHDCGWCPRWLELLLAYREGRREEAAHEAERMTSAGEGALCALGRFTRAEMRIEGFIK